MTHQLPREVAALVGKVEEGKKGKRVPFFMTGERYPTCQMEGKGEGENTFSLPPPFLERGGGKRSLPRM